MAWKKARFIVILIENILILFLLSNLFRNFAGKLLIIHELLWKRLR